MGLATHLLEQIQLLAKQSPHQEVCGIIDDALYIHPITNVAKHGLTCFVFSRKEYFTLLNTLQKEGRRVLCVYHSHPSGNVEASKADIEFTKRSGLPQLIVTPTAYRIIENA
jgi:proteasome lid subunit RPN8/RPN11